jgi:hypothetical protein
VSHRNDNTSDDYPNDSDGDALRLVASHGSDMSQPMLIDFPVVVANETLANEFAEAAKTQGYTVSLWKHDDDEDWDVYCSVEMVPTYADLVRIQRELTDLASPFKCICNSWGTFGNKDTPAS